MSTQAPVSRVDLAAALRGRIWSDAIPPAAASQTALASMALPPSRRHAAASAFLLDVSAVATSTFARDEFTAVAFDAFKGSVLAAVDARGRIFVFRLADNRFAIVDTVGAAGTCVSFSPKRRAEALFGFANHTARCYDVDSNALVALLKGHTAPISSVEYAAQGTHALTCSRDVVFVWSTDSWARLRALQGVDQAGMVRAVFAHPPVRQVLALFGDDSIAGWSLDVYSLDFVLVVPDAPRRCRFSDLVLTRDNRFLIAAGWSPHVYVWDVPGRSLRYVLEMPATCKAVLQIATVPETALRVTILGDDGSVLLFRLDTLEVLCTIGGLSLPFSVFSVSQHGRYLACAAPTRSALHLYDFEALVRAQAAVLEGGPVPKDKSFLIARRPPQVKASRADTSVSRSAGGTGPLWAEALDDAALSPRQVPALPSKATRRKRSKAKKAAPPKLGETRAQPQVRLARTMDKEAVELNEARLKQLLKTHGEFPEKYRLLVYKFLLQLPGNEEAYAALMSRGAHPALEKLHERYPIKSKRLFAALKRTMSALCWWCPMLSQVQFLPSLVFPFVKVFGQDHQACFEAVVTILLNWCQDWFQFFPHPPLNVLAAVDHLLGLHDPALLTGLTTLRASSQMYAWPLLESFLTQALTRSEWCRVFDHLVADNPSLLIFVVVAYLVHFRSALLSAESAQDIEAFCRQCNAVDVDRLLRLAREFKGATLATNLPAAVPSGFEPIRGDTYPIFSKFPSYRVNHQIAEQKRLREEEEDLLRRRANLEELRRRTEDLEREERDWEQQQAALLDAEEQRRIELFLHEEERLYERLRLEEMSREERLRQIGIIEDARRTFVETQRSARETELRRLEDEISRRAALRERELRSRLEEEAILHVEFHANKRMAEVDLARENERITQQTRHFVETRRREMEAKDRLQMQTWKAQDDEERAKAAASREVHLKLQQIQQGLDARARLAEQLKLEDLDAEYRKAHVERERRVRLAEQTAVEQIEVQSDALKKQKALLQLEEEQYRQQLIADDSQWRKQLTDERKEILDQELRAYARENELRAETISELEKQQRRREFEMQLLEKRRQDAALTVHEERELQAILMRIAEEQKKDLAVQRESQVKQREFEDLDAFMRRLRKAEEQAIDEERSYFQDFRDKLRQESRKEQDDAQRLHKTRVRELLQEREKQLLKMEQESRRRARELELMSLEREAKDATRRAAEEDDALRAREEILRQQIRRDREILEQVAGSSSRASEPPSTLGEPATTAEFASMHFEPPSAGDGGASPSLSDTARRLLNQDLQESAKEVLRKHRSTREQLKQILKRNSPSNAPPPVASTPSTSFTPATESSSGVFVAGKKGGTREAASF